METRDRWDKLLQRRELAVVCRKTRLGVLIFLLRVVDLLLSMYWGPDNFPGEGK